MVTVGSARIDENGKARGGAAGDQNGREVSTQAWYKHEKGWTVLRPKDRDDGRDIAYAMKAACDNPCIGYDQGQRLTLYNAASVVLFDPARVTVKCETDCSALVRVCLAYAGIRVGNFTTANEVSLIMNSGRFEKLTAAKYTDKPDYLRAGDVLVTRTQGHTVIVLNDGPRADEYEPAAPANPVQEDGSIIAYTTGTWHIRKTPGKGSKDLGILLPGSQLRIFGRSPSMPTWLGVQVLQSKNKIKENKGYVSEKAFPGLKL